MRVALLYEHPTWSASLIDRASARGLDLTPIDVGHVDLASIASGAAEFDLWVNRVNAMPSSGRSPSIVAATGHLLLSLELAGQRVVNGSQTHRIGGSKAAQTALFSALGLGTPASVSIFEASQAPDGAETIGYPVITKPNIGGSGSGIVRYDSAAELQLAVDNHSVDLGIDGTGLVQRVIESADGMIYRVEMLGSDVFYGTTQQLQDGAFNYCAADGCAIDDDAAPGIALFTPPAAIVSQVAQVMAAASTLVGGVEYLIDATTGQPSFYDFNPYSNFVSGYDDQLGFDPIERYLDFILTLGN